MFSIDVDQGIKSAEQRMGEITLWIENLWKCKHLLYDNLLKYSWSLQIFISDFLTAM